MSQLSVAYFLLFYQLGSPESVSDIFMTGTPPPLPPGPVPLGADRVKPKRLNKQQRNTITDKIHQPKIQKQSKSDKSRPVTTDGNVSKATEGSSVVPEVADDGWEHYFDETSGRFFFYNNVTRIKQWRNPRVPADDEFNRNLPTYDPPPLPFETESEYTKALRALKEDEGFQSLSTYQKYQKAEALKKQFEDDDTEKSIHTVTSEQLKQELEGVEPFADDTNFNEFGSKSMYAKELNDSIRTANSTSATKKKQQSKISKQKIKQFNDKRKQQRENKLKTWLTKD